MKKLKVSIYCWKERIIGDMTYVIVIPGKEKHTPITTNRSQVKELLRENEGKYIYRSNNDMGHCCKWEVTLYL